MAGDPFERNVFINCPFDEDYEPILQAIAFCVIYLGFVPRLAAERIDGAENRLEKIVGLIRDAGLSIHDLSRSQAREAGEHYRMNMPFELGIDVGCRQFGEERFRAKKILVLERERYRHQIALSDIAGCDIEAHGDDFQKAVRKVRNWLVSEAGGKNVGAARVLGSYYDFQEWHYERQLERGFDEEDIRDYPTAELLDAMSEWIEKGEPV